MSQKEHRQPHNELVSLAEVIVRYPYLEDWLFSRNMPSAQVLEGRRILSAEEKVIMFGGEAQVRENLIHDYSRSIPTNLILQACKLDYMTAREMNRPIL